MKVRSKILQRSGGAMQNLDSLPLYLAFDDLSILPARNRGTPDDVSLASRISRHITVQIPFISADMPSVTAVPMAIALAEFGGLGVLHRFMAPQEQCDMVRAVRAHVIDRDVYPNASLGPDGRTLTAASVAPQDVERAVMLAEAGAHILFFDTPNASNEENLRGAEKIRARVDVDLVAGQLVDAETALDYLRLGVDALKVSLGSGALCSIRLVAGVGAPQVTALADCCQAAAGYDAPIVSAGGIRTSGDIVKALAVGAESVMIGSLLAGCDEAPGEIIEQDSKRWKRAAGTTIDAIELQIPTGYPKVDAYLTQHRVGRIEGGEGLLPATGPCHLALLRLVRGVRVGIQMAGAVTVRELKDKARLIRVSPPGSVEGQIHI
jgi:IMP dehydrogenase/GMP reductase